MDYIKAIIEKLLVSPDEFTIAGSSTIKHINGVKIYKSYTWENNKQVCRFFIDETLCEGAKEDFKKVFDRVHTYLERKQKNALLKKSVDALYYRPWYKRIFSGQME